MRVNARHRRLRTVLPGAEIILPTSHRNAPIAREAGRMAAIPLPIEDRKRPREDHVHA